MKNHIYTILAFVFIGLLIGCATSLTKNECLEADWYEIGYIDGTNGEPRAQFQKHAENCSQYYVHVGREAYYRGRDQGLKIYCTKDKGFNLGKLGKKYNPICPEALESDFHAGYTIGKEVYTSESRISYLERRLQRIESQMETKNKQLYSSDLSEAERAEIRADIHDLAKEYQETVRDLRYWEKKQRSE